MKIIDLKCPACGGNLNPLKDHPEIAVCEYCGSQYQLESEEPVVSVQERPYSPQNNEKSQDWTRIVLFGIAFLFGSLFFSLIGGLSSGRSKPKPDFPDYSFENEYSDTWDLEEEDHEFGPLFQAFVETVFQKDAELVTEAELRRITYIGIWTGSEADIIEYGFGDPYGEESFETERLSFEPLVWENEDLSCLTGLVKADFSDLKLGAGSLKMLEDLKGLSVSKMEFSEIGELLPSPEQLIELEVYAPDSLMGVSDFKNLEILSVRNIVSPDFRQLVPLEHLTSVRIEEKSEDGVLTDYTAFSTMTELRELQIESEAIRELSFLKSLNNLEHLSLSGTETISLEPLAAISTLSALELENNNSVQDYNPVGQLTGLKELTINKNTSTDDPDLSGLTKLEKLDICGFTSIGALSSMGQLKELTIHSCNIDEISQLSSLSQLESFSCYSVWSYHVPPRDLSFLDGMTNLKYLDFCGSGKENLWGAYERGIEIFGDISNAFNHPGLEALILNEGTFEIDFGKLQENASLKRLEMKNVNLKENFYVESYNGMRDVWYDDVSFDEHKEFLVNYPGLEVLYLDNNQLTDIQFVAALKNLTHLGIQDNYVTELSALNQLEKLQYLDIRMNPISGPVEANENVRILK